VSERAFLQQGIPKDTIQSCISGVHPTKFETGNGTFTSDTCIELQNCKVKASGKHGST
jgi:hypothetical protein